MKIINERKTNEACGCIHSNGKFSYAHQSASKDGMQQNSIIYGDTFNVQHKLPLNFFGYMNP